MRASVGTPAAWAARYLKMNGRRRLLGSFNHESMANALLQAIGAQAAFPKRRVVSMSGDGGFAMMMGAFPTLVQASLPACRSNNGTPGFVELEMKMKASGFLDVGCDLKNPDFAAMARAVGIKGVRVEHPQDASLGDAGRTEPRRTGAARRRQRAPGTGDAAGHDLRRGA